MTKLMRFLGVGVMSLCFAAIACGGSDDDGGTNSSGSASSAACKELCDKQVAGGCSLLDAASCKMFCDAIYQSVNADCQQKNTLSSECQNAAADPCMADTECQAEIQAASDCVAAAGGG